MREYILYGTLGCHLCELAEQQLSLVLGHFPDVQIELVDIAESDMLIESLGEKIPVLERCVDLEKLFWPFDAQACEAFLAV